MSIPLFTSTIATEPKQLQQALRNLDQPVHIVLNEHGEPCVGGPLQTQGRYPLQAWAPAYTGNDLGDSAFKRTYEVTYAYHGGAMANGIASVELVVALAKAGFLASFGAAGLTASAIQDAVTRIQSQLPKQRFAVNVIHSPSEPALERDAVACLIDLGVTAVEASAYLELTEPIVYYRVSGLSKQANGDVNIGHNIIAKVSRTEVARKFMMPPPQRLLDGLLAKNKITPEQAALARMVPMADDITVEADSGGHTDNRPLVTLLPAILALKVQIQQQQGYREPLRVGAGGGIATPASVHAVFAMGAAYAVIGSVNQACVESGTSDHVRQLLAQADIADVTMAPAADMFEMGVKLQVLKRGTMFAMRANKLYDLYCRYDSLDAIPHDEKTQIENQLFQASCETIWQQTQQFFAQRDPEMLSRAINDPKRQMALVFRWYLGLSSQWANQGIKGREMDYQVWAGPAMGAFNQWAKGTVFEQVDNRSAPVIAEHLWHEAAYLSRLQLLRMQGVLI